MPESDWFTENGFMPEEGASMPVSGGYNPAIAGGGIAGNLPGANTGFAGGPMNNSGAATMPASGGGGQFDYNAFRQRAEALSQGGNGSTADFVNRIYPQLAQEFQGLERFGSKGDKIRLPTGETIDAVISAGTGGRGYNWGIEQPGGGAHETADSNGEK